MKIEFAPEDLAFAAEVRAFARAHIDPLARAKVLNGKQPSRAERTEWQRRLIERGWGAPAWPVEYGGTGWTLVRRHLFDEVMAEEGAPMPPMAGMGMLAPLLMRFGSTEQKRTLIPRILTIADWWCQGFSEPGAGSDLAALRTRAVLDGDSWVVNGHKIWTTLAHVSDKMFCLVRTSDEPRKQAGLSMLLIDMGTPGITVRPIITIDGEHELNEVFLEDVRVPRANLIGEAGDGWSQAKYLLSHERTGIARVGQSRREIARLKAIAAREAAGGGRLIDDPGFRARVADLETRHAALEWTVLRMLAAQQAGAGPGAEASLLKIKGSELQQDIAELMLDTVGHYATPYDRGAWADGRNDDPIGPPEAGSLAGIYLNFRKLSIYSGSNEIQRNILAKAALGL